MTIIIKNLAISGYRSFGEKIQYFDKFEKINLIIGRNNAGKSNVIRFISDMYPKVRNKKDSSIETLAYHLPDRPSMKIGIGDDTTKSEDGTSILHSDHRLLINYKNEPPLNLERFSKAVASVINEKKIIDSANLCWTIKNLSRPDDSNHDDESWLKATKVLSDKEMYFVWNLLTKHSNGDRKIHWEPAVIKYLSTPLNLIDAQVIPAIRKIGLKGSISDEFDGSGIIERLAKLQNPDAHNQTDRNRFIQITNFLRIVIDNPEATIEIPYERDTILVHMDQKGLPIESLGSGIHEVIILAAAATVLSNHVVCIEEPELHLNPILQRKLIRYLSENTNNQYFLSTHSAAMMDNIGIEIYHVKLHEGVSIVDRVTSDRQRSFVCEDLGYHPSDLLQANCVIWVEGPSDRVYLNYWIKGLAPDVVEGIHYSIMFYGGRLASHLSNDDDTDVENFISLRRLNRRGVMILDSDREKSRAHINDTKIRLQREFDDGPGHSWVTDGREIENYIPESQLRAAIVTLNPTAAVQTTFGKYENCLKIKSKKGRETQASKVDVARHVVEKNEPDFSQHDLKQRMSKLLTFIRDSNPQVKHA